MAFSVSQHCTITGNGQRRAGTNFLPELGRTRSPRSHLLSADWSILRGAVKRQTFHWWKKLSIMPVCGITGRETLMGIGRTGSSVEAALNAAYLLSQGFEMIAC